VFPGGGGGVGHMGIQIAKAMGMRCIAIDGGDEKRDLCLKTLGAEEFVDFTKVKSVEEEVMRITGGVGAHGIFVTAGSAAAYKSAPMMVRVGGRVMCIGLREFHSNLEL
jgi:propanol-preferring alcohol dehydrogenase